MMGPGPNLGYSRGPQIFKNVEAMQVEVAVAKEIDAVSKSR